MATTNQRQDGNISSVSMLRFSRDDLNASVNNIGGNIINCTSNSALNTGDIVYMDNTGKVGKSAAVGSNYSSYRGVVVGGKLTTTDCVIYGTGVPATDATDQLVYVQISGNALVVAGGTIAFGASVIPDTVIAGRVIAGSTATLIVGNAVSAGVVATDMIIFIEHR